MSVRKELLISLVGMWTGPASQEISVTVPGNCTGKHDSLMSHNVRQHKLKHKKLSLRSPWPLQTRSLNRV
jgi:hypothetical protein